jgi:hypothetical protein
MTAAGLLSVEKQGRHRYHRLASPGVAHMMESIMQVASDLEPPRKRLTVGPREAALRRARTCYDHLAGKLGVVLTDALVAARYAEVTNEAGLVTDSGIDFLLGWGLISMLLWRPALRNRGVSYVGHASIGANGDGTWRGPSERPYGRAALLTDGYGGSMAHEPL